jgi:hypothetical protein
MNSENIATSQFEQDYANQRMMMERDFRITQMSKNSSQSGFG